MLMLESDAFEAAGPIPRQFTCEGDNINPGLFIDGAPAGTRSLALLVDDPDVPKQIKPDGVFDHWVVFNIPPDVGKIPQGGPVPGVEGKNGSGQNAYMGPCPPLEYEPSEHRYYFRLYALDKELDLDSGATKADVLAAMESHVLGVAELVGRYRKQGQ